MFNSISLISILEVILLMLPTLLSVAFVTVAERKTMASMQRRLGPNATGYMGLLQAFADALKLLIKEYVAPTQANILLFFLGPVITLFFALLGFSVIPFGPISWIADLNYGILVILAVSSVASYGILLAGWSANSKFAFLGSIRSTAQLISYELMISSVIILVIMITSSLNLNVNVLFQKIVWFAFPLFPILLIFFISALAETNRAPFDLAEAESELVSGFMTEHSAVVFVFFFLAEYASILLMCILTSSLFLGGYLMDFTWLVDIYVYLVQFIDFDYWLELTTARAVSPGSFALFPGAEGLISGLVLGIKSALLVFTFIWVRASLPRIRFDQLMSFCWTVLLPLLFAFIVFVPCILFSFDAFVVDGFSLLALPFFALSEKGNSPLLNRTPLYE
jgi:NADH-ubiquinone oxidoreductase chain 1